MCGITGIINKNNNIILSLYESLTNIQHRGQESSGIVTYSFDNKIKISKEIGLVDKHIDKLNELQGYIGIGHVRYPTTGEKTNNEIQPFIKREKYEVSLVHNGNIVVDKDILSNLKLISSSDSEIILEIFIGELKKYSKLDIENGIINSIKKVRDICKGSYSLIIMIKDIGLIVFRDKYGIRPLVYEEDKDYIQIASETIGLINNNNYKNVKGGELIIINKDLNIKKIKIEEEFLKPCLFEYIYFARAESYINNILVYNFREKVGEKVISMIPEDIISNIDCIVPIPLTSIISATIIADKIKKPVKHAIVKNRYTHRTFINRDKEIMRGIKKIKIIKELIKDKNILLVDDSIVRGNTSQYIINMLKKIGVNKIYFVSCSPPIRYPNIYGIALPTTNDLIAYNKTEEMIEKELGVDKLYYLSLENIKRVLIKLNPKLENFEDSVFTGKYLS